MTSSDLAEQVLQFYSEDTDTWVEAALAVGQAGEAALPTLARNLPDRQGVHGRRHAWCALASYLEATRTTAPDPTLAVLAFPGGKAGKKAEEELRVPVRTFVRELLVGAILEGLKDAEVSLGELAALPGFDTLRQERLVALEQERADKATRLGKTTDERARAGIEASVCALEAARDAWSSDETTLAGLGRISRVALGLPSPPRIPEWCFGSLVAGLRLPLLRSLGIPVGLLVRALAELAAPGGDRIAYVKNLHRMLAPGAPGTAEHLDAAMVEEILGALARRLPDPLKGPVHWVEYVLALQELAEGWRVRLQLNTERSLEAVEPESVRALYQAWEEARDEVGAARLVRACEERFCDELRWAELPQRERLVLPIFHLAIVAWGGGGKGRLGLEHRLEYLREVIHRWQDSNPEILALLVRTWKLLLHEELVAAGTGPGVVATCLRHVRWIEPLVARWNLRSIILKDLATIAARALCAVHTAWSGGGASYDDVLELAYTVLHALPERQLLREMHHYSAPVPWVRVLMARIRGVLDADTPAERAERWESYLDHAWTPAPAAADGRTTPDAQALDQLVDVLSDPAGVRALAPAQQGRWGRTLAWLVGIRERARLAEVARRTSLVNKVFRQELAAAAQGEVDRLVGEVERVVKEIARLDLALEELGGESDPVETLRVLVMSLRELEGLLRNNLPVVERSVVIERLVALREHHERRHAFLASVLESEHEGVAIAALDLADPDWPEPAENKGSYTAKEQDRRLLVRWMVGRYMLRELSRESRILRLLTSPLGVGLWLLLPFALGSLIHLLDRHASPTRDLSGYIGLPFLLMPLVGVPLLFGFLFVRGGRFETRDRAAMLVPQMVGALFLGIMERFGADEVWSIAIGSHPLIRLVNIAIFLVGTVFFVRFGMLRGQQPRPRGPIEGGGSIGAARVLWRRTLSLLSLGLWQSFLFVTVYSVLMGDVMMKRFEAAQALTVKISPLQPLLESVIPSSNPVHLPWGLMEIHVLPWAILTWTVELFFFSAIFERIMNRK
ncbi:MAG: hypothetical protein ABIO70_12440 [Pseudomonadota bacterium]